MPDIITRLTPKIDQSIRHQAKQYFASTIKKGKRVKPVITLSREFGCEALPTARKLSELLKKHDGVDWIIYNRKLIAELTENEDFDKELIASLNEQQRSQVEVFVDKLLAHKPDNYTLYKQMAQNVNALARKGNCIIVGSGGAILNQNIHDCLHIRLKADLKFRIKRISKTLSISENEAEELIEENERARQQMIKSFTKKDIRDQKYYDLIIDNQTFNSDHASELIVEALKRLVPNW